jgi:Ca2+-binding EF-hand superfamily protein
MSCNRKEAEAALTAAFKQVDTNHSDSIDAAELKTVLQSYYKSSGKTADAGKIESEANAFLKEVDKDRNGSVNLKEFVEYFMQFCG